MDPNKFTENLLLEIENLLQSTVNYSHHGWIAVSHRATSPSTMIGDENLTCFHHASFWVYTILASTVMSLVIPTQPASRLST